MLGLIKTNLVPLEEFRYAIFDFHFMLPVKAVELGDINELVTSHHD